VKNLADVYLRTDRHEEALAMYDEYIAARRRRAEEDDPAFASVLAKVSLDLLQHEQYSAAEVYSRECLQIREKALPDHWLLFNAKSSLGGALLGQAIAELTTDRESALKKLADAEPLLVSGYEGMKERRETIPDVAQPRLTEATKRLVDLYEAWEKPDEASRWQEELDAD
jgi:hypothetical protein